MANLGKNLGDKQREINELKKELQKQKREYEVLPDKFVAMEIDRDMHKDRYDKLYKGATLYWLNKDGYIYNAVTIEGYFHMTYPQVLPSDINKVYYKVTKGEIELDTVKRRKIRGGL